MPAPRETAAQVWINGQPRGIFEIEEIWGKEALASRFADPNGPLYRIRGPHQPGSVRIQGSGSGGVRAAALGSGGRAMPDPADAVIGAALRVVAEEPARIGEVMDVDMLLTYFAASAILSNTDGFTGPFEVDDHFQYFDPETGSSSSCRGIPTTRSDRSTICPTPTST